jgi:nicotinamidase/pyrazinamidase
MIDAALIVIDVQNDFCPGGSLAVEGGDRILPVVNSLARKFRRVIATKDWHPADHVSFASQHEGHEPMETIKVDGRDQILWPDHCVQTTKGAEFHPDFDTHPVDLIVHKGTNPGLDSYSAFFENDHKTPTGLEGYLKSLDISTVYIVGLAADVCVYFSAMDARKVGLETYLVTDGTRGVDQPEGNVERTREDMKQNGVRFVTSGEVA